MHCPTCHGRGLVAQRHPDGTPAGPGPCPACWGSGVAHCCDGPVGAPDEDGGGPLVPDPPTDDRD